MPVKRKKNPNRRVTWFHIAHVLWVIVLAYGYRITHLVRSERRIIPSRAPTARQHTSLGWRPRKTASTQEGLKAR